MSRLLLAALAALVSMAAPTGGPAQAADTCPGFFSDRAADALLKRLSSEPCKAAVVTLNQCRWASAADVAFAPPVVKTCERAFLARLSPAARRAYGQRMRMCADRYVADDGSMYVSEAVVCQADLAAAVAAAPDPAKAIGPVRASFDCARAQTPMETAICSDPKLGEADVILSDAYRDLRGGSAGGVDKAKLVASERRFLATVTQTCRLTGLGPSNAASIACVRKAFETRYTALDECGDDPDCHSVETKVAPPA